MIASALPAKSLGNPAAIATGLQLMGTLSALANQASSGLAEQFQAINIKLDQVLDNQANILVAIQNVQNSLDSLRNDIQGLLTFDLYRNLAIDIAEHNIRLRQFADFVRYDADRVKQDTVKRAEYQNLLLEIRRLISRFSATVANTDLLQQNVGSKGLNSLLVFAPSLVILPHSLRLLYGLEGLYADISWHLIDYQQQCKTLEDTYEAFRLTHLQQVKDFQLNQFFSADAAWWDKFPKGKTENTRQIRMLEGSESATPGDGVSVVSTTRFSAVRCYVSQQFRTGSIDHGLFYKNVFSLIYDQETETVPISWFPSGSIDVSMKITPRPIKDWGVEWHDLEYHGFLSDGPRIVSIGDQVCDELTDKSVGESAKKPYDLDADKNKVVQQFNKEIVELVNERNQAAIRLVSTERIRNIAYSMSVYSGNFRRNMESFIALDQRLGELQLGPLHWRPLDPETRIGTEAVSQSGEVE